jgi:integrase/recombinase XerD
MLQAVGALDHCLVRRGKISAAPVCSGDVPRGTWLTEHDLLAHTRRGRAVVQRMELKRKEPGQLPPTSAEPDFQSVLNSIHMGQDPNGDPTGFRDRLLCLLLKEGGFRIGAALGMRMEDLELGKHGGHVCFRPDDENGARAQAGDGNDRFVHVPTDVLGLLDIDITEVWIEASPHTDHLCIVLKQEANNREGQSPYGAALTVAALEKVLPHYSKKAGVILHPHGLRHTHATALVRSSLQDGAPVDWKFVQERLGHGSRVTTMQPSLHWTNEERKHAYER